MANIKKDTKTVSAENKTNEVVNTKSDEKVEINKADLDLLMKRIAKLEDDLNKTKQNQPTVVTPLIESTLEYEEIIDVPLTKSIKVMSLYNGGMTLFTQDHGQGKKFRFEKFGDIRTIQYSDLDACIAVQHRFFEQGYCIILNPDVVKIHGFEDTYKKLLTKKQIDNILTYDDKTLEALFSNTTDHIRQVIVDIVVNKILKNEYVDMNKVQIINKYYPRDLNEIISFLRESQNVKKEE